MLLAAEEFLLFVDPLPALEDAESAEGVVESPNAVLEHGLIWIWKTVEISSVIFDKGAMKLFPFT